MGIVITRSKKKIRKMLGETVSISVDCDSLKHYLNFAPQGTDVEKDKFTFPVMCRNLLRILEKLKIKATFFCIAEQLNDPVNLSVYREIVQAGHEIGNHTFSHPDIAFLDEEKHLLNIRLAHQAIMEVLKVKPAGYRAPAYFITEGSFKELKELGYSYDSSLCYSRATRIFTYALKIINRNYQPKRSSGIHSRFKGLPPYNIEFDGINGLTEWPIPNVAGLAYYGTLHCCMPSQVFNTQTAFLNLRKKYIHYELHPIELISKECVEAFPWLRKIPFVRREDLSDWMEYRLQKLISGRKPLTLKELNDAYLYL
ncbi:MAG: polysaccharide deacetylase family protein [Candidatus Omnitrophica bacterium]|nr:polysaccharide deacetylase family protein [Candidatus Omnitrophota bacterium]